MHVDRRRGGQAGVSRASVLIGGAVIAAVLVLSAGAIRSGPSPSTRASGGPSAFGSLSATPRPPTEAPSDSVTPAPAQPTEIPVLRGEFVGALGRIETCPILYLRNGAVELVLPDEYRSRIRSSRVQILDGDGAVVAAEGDLLGIDGRVREGGSSCLAGPRLHVSRIVEVIRR